MININKKFVLFTLVLVFSFGIFLLPYTTHAETRVYDHNDEYNPYIPRRSFDLVWTKEGSPYIIEENVWIMHGSSLTIEEGVTVMSASTTSMSPNKISFDGNLIVNGTKESPVQFIGLDNIFFSKSESEIKYAQLQGSYLYFHISTSTVDHVVITRLAPQ